MPIRSVFRVDFGFGRAFEASLPWTRPGRRRCPPPHRAGLREPQSPRKRRDSSDIGKFVTSAGAEVIESKDNWNYSRSLLFAWAIPYYHFGPATTCRGQSSPADSNSSMDGTMLRTTTAERPWDLTLARSPPRRPAGSTTTTWAGEYRDSNKGLRHLHDTTWLRQRHQEGPPALCQLRLRLEKKIPSAAASRWTGVAFAARYGSTIVATPRIEWFNDKDGFSTGTDQKLKEFTFTGEYKVAEGPANPPRVPARLVDKKFFERGGTGGSKSKTRF